MEITTTPVATLSPQSDFQITAIDEFDSSYSPPISEAEG
jgi:hypothetical protein